MLFVLTSILIFPIFYFCQVIYPPTCFVSGFCDIRLENQTCIEHFYSSFLYCQDIYRFSLFCVCLFRHQSRHTDLYSVFVCNSCLFQRFLWTSARFSPFQSTLFASFPRHCSLLPSRQHVSCLVSCLARVVTCVLCLASCDFPLTSYLLSCTCCAFFPSSCGLSQTPLPFFTGFTLSVHINTACKVQLAIKR